MKLWRVTCGTPRRTCVGGLFGVDQDRSMLIVLSGLDKQPAAVRGRLVRLVGLRFQGAGSVEVKVDDVGGFYVCM
jgi:hypothetical protein